MPASGPFAWGRYLALSVGDCFVCHSRSFPTLDARFPEKSADFMAGGNELRDATGTIVRGANLTMDRDTGIGAWSEADFIGAVRSGVRPDGRVLRYPMVAFRELSDEEVSAIFAYLRTLPPMRKAIDRGFAQLAQQIASASKLVPGSKMPAWNDVIAEADWAPLIAHVGALQTAPPKP